MDEAQALADRLAIMRAGQIVAHGHARRDPVGARGRDDAHPLRGRRRCHAASSSIAPADARPTEAPATSCALDDPVARPAPTDRLGARPEGPADGPRRSSRPSLEDTYLELTGEAAESGERRRMSTLRLLLRQIRYENRAFWRNPAAAFFTFAFPLIFMVVFQRDLR